MKTTTEIAPIKIKENLLNNPPLKNKNVFVKVKGILVPFFQANPEFESNFILTTNDGVEFTIIKADNTNYLDKLCWSVVDVFGYVVSEERGRKTLKIEHFSCNEHDDYFVHPFLNEEKEVWPEVANSKGAR